MVKTSPDHKTLCTICVPPYFADRSIQTAAASPGRDAEAMHRPRVPRYDEACLAEDLYRLHTSDAYRRMPRHERLESESRLRELSVRDDYAPSMEEARRGWCVDNGMLERGVSLCRVWRDNYLRSKREL